MVTVIPTAFPCSRVRWGDNGGAVVVGRRMNGITNEVATDLYLLPRAITRDELTGENTLKWTAKYGSGSVEGLDGMNKKGLSGSMLWLAESDFGPFDPSRPSMSVARWLQYYLDNFATVKEAVDHPPKAPDAIGRR